MTTQLRLPPTTTREQYVQLGGGLDQLTPVLQLKPGFVRDSQNWEQSINGGYSRIVGYERFDGRKAPSSAVYFTATITQSLAIAIGATVVGAASGATGTVLSLTPNAGQIVLAYTMATGAFIAGENLKVGGIVVASGFTPGGSGAAPNYDATQRGLAANTYRALVQPVPGSGACRGGFYYRGAVYVFRDDPTGTSLKLWKSSITGWVSVSIPTMLPGGRVQTAFGNFDGTVRVYGCDGVNKGWVFDASLLVLITTANVPDVPDNVMVHKDHLWFSFNDNVQCSGIAQPLVWTALAGSVSFRMNGPVTSMQSQPGSQAGGVASITTETDTEMIYGNSAIDFQKVSFEQSAGARLYGVQRLGGQTLAFSNLGAYSLSATQSYGNFTPATLTMKIRPFTSSRRNQCNASLINREKSQYRVFFNDGFGLYITVLNGRLQGSMPVFFKHRVVTAWQGQSDDGDEASYFTSTDGMVYRLDSGTSCDGQSIDSYMVLPFNNQGATRTLKTYRGGTFEIQGTAYAEFTVSYELGYGGADRPQGLALTSRLALGTVKWDSDVHWDDAVMWDGKALLPSTLELSGTGENIAIRIDCNSAIFDSFTMNSIVLAFKPRRQMRATQ